MNLDLENLSYLSFAKEKITVFISYAWFDENDSNHGKWVSSFKNKLELLGIDPIFDRQDARNSDCREFMKKSIEECDFVICICSDKYVERYNKEGEYANKPGASNEGELITKRIQTTINPESFLIPIVKNNSRDDDKKLPDVFPNMFWRNFDGQDSLCAEEFYILGDILRAQGKGLVSTQNRGCLRGSVQPRIQVRFYPDAGDLGKTRHGLHGRLQDGPLRLPVLPQRQRSHQVQH